MEEVQQTSNSNSNLKISIKTFSELAEEGKTTPNLRKVFGNFILERNTVLFIAERGTGKTFLGMQLCIAVARGDSHFCGEEIELHGNTLFINLELGEKLFAKRASKLFESTHTAFPHRAIVATCRGNMDSVKQQIEALIEEYKPDLVVVDNLRTAFSNMNNENNKEMTNSIMKLNYLKDKHGFSLVLVHHTKKGTSSLRTNSDMQSGAGAISDLVDADFFMRRSRQNKQQRLLKRIKSRNCEEQDGAKLIEQDPDTLWFFGVDDNVEEGDHIQSYDNNENGVTNGNSSKMSQAFQMRAEGKSITEIARVLGVNKSTVSRWFNSAR